MNDVRKVEMYGWHCYVSREMWRHYRGDLKRLLQSQIEGKVDREGYVPMSDTFDVQFYDPRDPREQWRPWSDEDREMSEKCDALTALVSIRCYARNP